MWRSVERWFASFPTNDPLAVHGEVLAELGRVADTDAQRSPQRLEAVFFLDGQCAGLRKSLTVQYIEHTRREARRSSISSGRRCSTSPRSFGTYSAFAPRGGVPPCAEREVAGAPAGIDRPPDSPPGHDARIRLYRYEQWIPGKWTELHGLFTLACSRHCERQQLVLGRGGTATTIEQEYLLVLLMQLMNTGNITAPPHRVGVQSAQRMVHAAAAVAGAVVGDVVRCRPGLARGLAPRSPAPLEGRVLFLDTRPLHSVLTQNILVLEQKSRGSPWRIAP